jgi:hypothetical protein
MLPPEIAEQLRARGYDVIAIAERLEMRGLPDRLVFELAQQEGRAIVTENVADFRPLAVERSMAGGSHAGLIFTSNRQFPRSDRRTPGLLVTALHDLLARGEDGTGMELWLQR